MPRQATLFDMPRKTPRTLLRVVDAGSHGCETTFPYFVHLKCPKCGHDAKWHEFSTKKQAMSEPCPVCNKTV